MSGLKSAWEISLEKSNKMNPDSQRKLTDKQKKAISEIRKEQQAAIADKEITLQHKLGKLADRLPPERIAQEAEALQKQFIEEKQALEKEAENRVEAVYNQK